MFLFKCASGFSHELDLPLYSEFVCFQICKMPQSWRHIFEFGFLYRKNDNKLGRIFFEGVGERLVKVVNHS